MTTVTAVTGTALVSAALLLVPTAASGATGLAGVTPGDLAHVGRAEQVIVVTAPSWRSTSGTLRTFERTGAGPWHEVVTATPAWLGYGGLVPGRQRRQGSGTTPAGTYAITSAFGRLPDPGSALPYRQFDRNDSWTYDADHPLTYNVFQTAAINWRAYGSNAEHLWAKGPQYRYVAVLDYNLPNGPIVRGSDGIRRSASPPNTKAGGGIFLHVSKGKPTAGCVSIPLTTMRDVLRWLAPAKHPVIVIGPASAIGSM